MPFKTSFRELLRRISSASVSEIEAEPTLMSMCCKLQAFFDEEEYEVLHPAGVAPLVVVPADDLAHVGADDLSQERVEDAAQGVAAEVGGDELFVGVTQDALHWAIGGGLDGGVDGFDW